MSCLMEHKIDFKKIKAVKKLAALVICVFFIAASILSAAFIFTYFNHEHDYNSPDKSCATCVHLAAAENLLKSVSIALTGTAFIYWGFSAVFSKLKSVSFLADFYTLVRLKVRLNN